jgi:hypothetical protein
MRHPVFPPIIPVLVAATLACGSAEEPAPVVLPPADPGQLIPGYPQIADFPNKGWDLDHNSLVVIDPKEGATNILRVDLDTRAPSLISSTATFVQQLRSGASGVVLYSDNDAADVRSLWSIDKGKITGLGRAQFALSDNGRWVVFYEGGWQRMELATGTRSALPDIDNAPPVAVANDGSRVAFTYSPSDFVVRIVDVSTGTVTSMESPEHILDAVFDGAELHLLTVAAPFVTGAHTSRFYDRSSSGAVIPLGMVTPEPGSGWDLQTCGSWSHGDGPRTAVVTVQMTYSFDDPLTVARFNFVRLGENLEIVGSADLLSMPECHLSPDGAWFVYASPAANGSAKLYLKKIKAF